MSNVIEVNQVSKSFGANQAVDAVSFQVPPGCVFALLGENGAGKSTLIRMLLGLVDADAGELKVLGRASRTSGEEIRRSVGYVPERPSLYEWMTAAEIGWFTAGFYGDGFDANYRHLLSGLDVPADRRISHMSKGMRAKVVLAMAMAHHPPVLILDEPTSGLDTLVRREFLASMIDQAAVGRTVLLSSHQIGEVERVADWIAILRDGRLLDVSQLDMLKASTRELTITMQGVASAPPEVEGRVLGRERHGRQWRLLVRQHADQDVDNAEKLLASDAVVAVESRTPSLEEIFVAYMTLDETPSASRQQDDVPTFV